MNRSLADIGRAIYEQRTEEYLKRSMSMENAQYLKNVVLGGIGRRPWSELRRKMVDCQANLPSYEEMLKYEKEVTYDFTEYQGGSKARLPDIVQVRTEIVLLNSYSMIVAQNLLTLQQTFDTVKSRYSGPGSNIIPPMMEAVFLSHE